MPFFTLGTFTASAQTQTDVAIIVEADTYVPAFYAGRTLPAPGSSLTATAIVTNSPSQSDTYSYRWEVNRAVVSPNPTQGQQSITFTAPETSEVLLSVTVYNDATVVGSQQIYVPLVTPELHFYETSSLFGLSSVAVGDEHILLGEETTIQAEPYYISPTIFTEDPYLQWNIDGAPVDNQLVATQSITLRHPGQSGRHLIDFTIGNRTILTQYTTGDFIISF